MQVLYHLPLQTSKKTASLLAICVRKSLKLVTF